MSSIVEGINQLGVPFSFVIWIVVICCAAGAFTSLAKELRKFACHRQDIIFKRELVDRGLEAEEVERIVHDPSPRRSRSEAESKGMQETEVYHG